MGSRNTDSGICLRCRVQLFERPRLDRAARIRLAERVYGNSRSRVEAETANDIHEAFWHPAVIGQGFDTRGAPKAIARFYKRQYKRGERLHPLVPAPIEEQALLIYDMLPINNTEGVRTDWSPELKKLVDEQYVMILTMLRRQTSFDSRQRQLLPVDRQYMLSKVLGHLTTWTANQHMATQAASEAEHRESVTDCAWPRTINGVLSYYWTTFEPLKPELEEILDDELATTRTTLEGEAAKLFDCIYNATSEAAQKNLDFTPLDPSMPSLQAYVSGTLGETLRSMLPRQPPRKRQNLITAVYRRFLLATSFRDRNRFIGMQHFRADLRRNLFLGVFQGKPSHGPPGVPLTDEDEKEIERQQRPYARELSIALANAWAEHRNLHPRPFQPPDN